jgi:hypothetical protein
LNDIYPAGSLDSRQDRGRSWFEVGRFRSGVAIAVLAVGLAAAGALPALASPPAQVQTPAVTIAARSLFKPVTGDVFVEFLAGKFANAQIHGTIRGGAGDVATLLAQPFSGPQVPVGSVRLTRSPESYTFTVTPALATRYQVLVRTSTSTVTSASSMVYVTSLQTASGTRKCPQTRTRPFCHQQIRVTEVVPASALADEMPKHWYFYFAVNLSQTRTPPPPRFAPLDARVRISRAVAGGARRFTRTLSWSFWTGVNGYSFVWVTCSKDTENADGLGLPGHHACGVRVIDTSAEYIG